MLKVAAIHRPHNTRNTLPRTCAHDSALRRIMQWLDCTRYTMALDFWRNIAHTTRRTALDIDWGRMCNSGGRGSAQQPREQRTTTTMRLEAWARLPHRVRVLSSKRRAAGWEPRSGIGRGRHPPRHVDGPPGGRFFSEQISASRAQVVRRGPSQGRRQSLGSAAPPEKLSRVSSVVRCGGNHSLTPDLLRKSAHRDNIYK